MVLFCLDRQILIISKMGKQLYVEVKLVIIILFYDFWVIRYADRASFVDLQEIIWKYLISCAEM